jgi:hypothetical protein
MKPTKPASRCLGEETAAHIRLRTHLVQDVFWGDLTARTCRNLALNPGIVVHLERGDDAVILAGTVEEATDPLVLDLYREAYEPKYKWRPDTRDSHQVTYALKPGVAFTWLEKDFPKAATRWLFR